ncbi:MAG: hypothetical protein RI885_40 [Actinomycetota bacterium]|jgi:uncharacterized protein YdhG (YjbR/CyaY superfamily)
MSRGFAAETVAAYLAAAPPAPSQALAALRATLLELIPGATERISYQVPMITYRDRPFLSYSVAKTHCSLHLMSPPAAHLLAAEVPPDRRGAARFVGATLQFPADQPPDRDLLEVIVGHRMAEVDARLDSL